ncbi:hypothetical protein Rs2_17323 [Raphanus sativus]|nr:hypothetical protein Rs2_17323 [Raphanus sativus]
MSKETVSVLCSRTKTKSKPKKKEKKSKNLDEPTPSQIAAGGLVLHPFFWNCVFYPDLTNMKTVFIRIFDWVYSNPKFLSFSGFTRTLWEIIDTLQVIPALGEQRQNGDCRSGETVGRSCGREKNWNGRES